MNDSQQLFRPEGIVDAIRTSAAVSAQDLLQAIWTNMEQHAGRTKELDDRTLLVLRIGDAA